MEGVGSRPYTPPPPPPPSKPYPTHTRIPNASHGFKSRMHCVVVVARGRPFDRSSPHHEPRIVHQLQTHQCSIRIRNRSDPYIPYFPLFLLLFPCCRYTVQQMILPSNRIHLLRPGKCTNLCYIPSLSLLEEALRLTRGITHFVASCGLPHPPTSLI